MPKNWKNDKTARFLQRAGAVLFALALWQTAAMLVGQPMLLASPVEAVKRLAELMTEKDFWKTAGYSLGRIALGFVCGLALGSAAAFAAARWTVFEILLRPFVVSMKSIPVASFIIVCLIWLSGSRLSSFIAFLMVFPVIYGNVLQGLKSTARDMIEMAEVFRLSPFRKLLYVQLPSVKPYLLSACSAAMGLAWKAGIAAEVIGIPTGSIGEKLYMAKVYFDTADLFAWTILIVLLSRCFEKLVSILIGIAYKELERR